MTKGNHYVKLEDRGVLAISGDDRVAFLQGLVSNNVELVSDRRCIYAAFLTPQGKFLCDFIISTDGVRLLLECDLGVLAVFKKKLQLYKLRSKVELLDVSDEFAIYAVYGDTIHSALGLAKNLGDVTPFLGGIAMVDPRLSEMGARVLLSKSNSLEIEGVTEGSKNNYDYMRIKLGVPDGSRDMQMEKTILLEAGFDELNGVDWNKGCYMGQELTARTKYRGLIKRRFMPVNVLGPLPKVGTLIMFGEREAGEIRTGFGDIAMALIRLNTFEECLKVGGELFAHKTVVVPQKQEWMNF
jgi:folate-binding protein YgfZ